MQLVNIMESLVRETMEDVTKGTTFCGCDKCRMDVMAIALNNLQPHYVVTDEGGVIMKTIFLQSQAHTDLVAAVAKAVDIVTRSPKHDAP